VKAEKGVYKADLVKVWEKAIAFQKPHREGTLSKFPDSDLATHESHERGSLGCHGQLLVGHFRGEGKQDDRPFIPV